MLKCFTLIDGWQVCSKKCLQFYLHSIQKTSKGLSVAVLAHEKTCYNLSSVVFWCNGVHSMRSPFLQIRNAGVLVLQTHSALCLPGMQALRDLSPNSKKCSVRSLWWHLVYSPTARDARLNLILISSIHPVHLLFLTLVFNVMYSCCSREKVKTKRS